VHACMSKQSITHRIDLTLPAGFHLIMPLNSDVSCSSVQGSFRMSYCGFCCSSAGLIGEAATIDSSSAAGGDEACMLAFAFFLGGILRLQCVDVLQLAGEAVL